MSSELILIVDDNVGIRSLLKEVLGSNGYKVEVAQNGEEAIEIFHKCVPSVVLLDSRIPGMNGVMVAEKLIQPTRKGTLLPLNSQVQSL